MNFGYRALVLALRFVVFTCLISTSPLLGFGQMEIIGPGLEHSAQARRALFDIAKLPPDPCGPPFGRVARDQDDLEAAVFRSASDAVADALNAAPGDHAGAAARAQAALSTIERWSSTINAAWPAENRLHFSVLNDSPLVIVNLGIRVDHQFFAFGVPETDDSNKPNKSWREVAWGESYAQRLDIYALHRGPKGLARFLASSLFSGCAGSVGITYQAWEWNPSEVDADEAIEVKGALGLDDKVPGFEQIGKLSTDGALITLPYCEFTPIDTWDNPSLCAVDTYDLSGDSVKFQSRRYNRPDLLPVARAIQYAEARDYSAVLAYCASPQLARRLVNDIAPEVFADDLQVVKISEHEERVTFENGFRFVVASRNGRWVIVEFSE